MKTTFNLIFISRSVLESRTHFFNSLIKIREHSPAILFFEPIIEEDTSQMLFLAKKISAYLSENGLVNSLITLQKFQNVPPQIPFIIAIPIKENSLKSYMELYEALASEFSVQEILLFTEDENTLTPYAKEFLSQHSYKIVSPVHKV